MIQQKLTFLKMQICNGLLNESFCRELVRGMLEEKEELRQKEIQFKEHCKKELTRLQKELQ